MPYSETPVLRTLCRRMAHVSVTTSVNVDGEEEVSVGSMVDGLRCADDGRFRTAIAVVELQYPLVFSNAAKLLVCEAWVQGGRACAGESVSTCCLHPAVVLSTVDSCCAMGALGFPFPCYPPLTLCTLTRVTAVCPGRVGHMPSVYSCVGYDVLPGAGLHGLAHHLFSCGGLSASGDQTCSCGRAGVCGVV